MQRHGSGVDVRLERRVRVRQRREDVLRRIEDRSIPLPETAGSTFAVFNSIIFPDLI
jgi:hypothetical protein